MNALRFVRKFADDTEGVSVIEYALIISVICIVFVVALRDVAGSNFSGFISRIATCLADSAGCA